MELVRTVEGSSANRARDEPGVRSLRGNRLVKGEWKIVAGPAPSCEHHGEDTGKSHRSQAASDGRAGYTDRIHYNIRRGFFKTKPG